jgi:hypothetical protein
LTFKEELIPIPLNLFLVAEREGTLPNPFYAASIIVIPNPNKNATIKENYRPLSLINMHANLNFTNITKRINRDQVGFISGMQEWVNI